MRPVILLVAALLVLPAVPSFAFAGEPAPAKVPAWLASMLEARGVPPEEWGRVQVERRTLEEGAWKVSSGSLDDLPEPPRATAPAAPDAVLGNLMMHFMVQKGGCAGYAVEPLAEGLTKVGGSWDAGFHVATAGSTPPGVATADPAGSLTGASGFEDLRVAGVGNLQIRESRIIVNGTCLVLIGQMSGPGVFAFGHSWPA